MTSNVIALQVGAGIQRDGTQFASPTYVDGKWVRFQYGRPRKIGGYNGAFINASGVSRGMVMSAQNGINYVISGYNNGVEQWTTDNNDAVGFGPVQISPSGKIVTTSISSNGVGYTNGAYTNVPIITTTGTGALATVSVSGGVVTSVSITYSGSAYLNGSTFTINASSIGGTGSGFLGVITAVDSFVASNNNLWQFDIGYDAYGAGNNRLLAHPSQNLNDITSTINTRPLVGQFTGNTLTPIGVFTVSGTITSGANTVTFSANDLSMSPGVSVSGTGIPANTTIISAAVTGGVWTVTLSNNATASGLTPLTFDNNISVSGGIVMLYPYLFVYGNNGLIQNSSANDFNSWGVLTADANANNVASTKIVKGLPVRGGTTSPAGLFWSLDSVIRVSYTPTTVGNQTFYWTYDLVTQQSSILSSQCVIEYDGIFYWAGVDRFLAYSGVVQEIENTQNFNYFFDNLNFSQRQKVWVSKVPRWGEIWWFFPNGNSTECNDAIIYNVRTKTWYDAGMAMGARRSAGVFSEVFTRPIWGGWDKNAASGYTLWEHEKGSDEIILSNVNAIESYFETNSLGAGAGLVGSIQQPGVNLWTRCERIEPDFVQSGNMTVVVTGKSYAEDNDTDSSPYQFNPKTLKIDMKEQRREMRLRFSSNEVGGDYFMGKIMLSIDNGDSRGSGNP